MSFDTADLIPEEPPPADRGGLRGWLERWAAASRRAWRAAEGPWARIARVVWDRLHRGAYADEPLLVRLRTAVALEIAHARSLARDDARQLWEDYLGSRRRRHGLWFTFNVAVSPLTVLLAPLPGPNLIGYWFAYRAVRHGLILSGLRKVKRGHVRATFHAVDEGLGPAERPRSAGATTAAPPLP